MTTPHVPDPVRALVDAGTLQQRGWYCAVGDRRPVGRTIAEHQLCAHPWPCGPRFVVAEPPPGHQPPDLGLPRRLYVLCLTSAEGRTHLAEIGHPLAGHPVRTVTLYTRGHGGADKLRGPIIGKTDQLIEAPGWRDGPYSAAVIDALRFSDRDRRLTIPNP